MEKSSELQQTTIIVITCILELRELRIKEVKAAVAGLAPWLERRPSD